MPLTRRLRLIFCFGFSREKVSAISALREQLAGAVGTSDFVASGEAAGGETRHRRADRVPARRKHDKQVLRPEPQRRKICSSARARRLC